MKLNTAILIAYTLTGCTLQPAAKLELAKIVIDPYHYDVQFDSDTDLLQLFPSNFFRRPVSTTFVCSIIDNPDFEVGNDLKNGGRGNVEFVKKHQIGERILYRHNAHLIFWKQESKNSQVELRIYPHDLIEILRTKPSIPCKFRVTLYVGPPYFSQTLRIPSADLISAAANMPDERMAGPRE